MKKNSWLIVITLLIALSLSAACTSTVPGPVQGSNVSLTQDSNTKGQTGGAGSGEEISGSSQGNIFFYNNIAESGGLLYFGTYLNNDNPAGLYSMKSDGSERVKLNDDRAICINAKGDFIYYRDDMPPDLSLDGIAGKGYIYRVNKDGSARTKIGENISGYFMVAGGWIYYQNAGDGMKLYRMKTDGSDDARITDEEADYFGVEGGWVYYYSHSKPWALYKIKSDGTEKRKICDHNLSVFIVQEGWIYFLDDYDGDCLHRMKTDGTGNIKLSEEMVSVFNVYKDKIYYTDVVPRSPSEFYMMNIDGTNKVDLKRENVGGTLIITGGWVYYERNEGKSYRMKLDGTGEVEFRLQ